MVYDYPPTIKTNCGIKERRRFGGASFTTLSLGALVALSVAMSAGAQELVPLTGVIKQTIDEDSSPQAFSLMLQAQDSDGDSIAWQVVEQPAHGKAGIKGIGNKRAISYVPAPDWNGVDRFTIGISDGLGGFKTLGIEVTVNPQNDPPQNIVAPQLVGLPQIGETLTIDLGKWDDSRDGSKGDFQYHYQWQVSEKPSEQAAVDIDGATGRSFSVREEDDGMYVRVVVTATDQEKNALSTSAASNYFKIGNAAPMFVQVAPEPPEPSVDVKQIAISGNEAIPTEELQPLVADFVGREVTLTELKEAAAAVTAEYRRRGMGLAKAYLPAQEIDDGKIEMNVVEGKPGTLEVEGNTIVSEKFVRKHIEAAMSGSAVSNRELERGLLIMNEDYPGLQVQSLLKRGQEPGTVDIVAQVKEEKRWRGFLGYNNFGSDFVSRHRFSVGAETNTLLLDGDLLSVQGTFGENPSELGYGAISYSLPINHQGTQVGLRLGGGSFEVSQEFVDLGLEGENTSAGLYVSHPFIKRRNVRLAAELGFSAEDATFDVLGQTSSSDRIRALYASLVATGDHWAGSSQAILTLTQGLGELAGGMSDGSSLASRPEAGNDFARLTMSLARQQPLGRYAGLLVRLDGQTSSDSLVSGQEWQIGGVNSVRGYSPGESTGDSGYNASLELQVRPFLSKPYSLVGFIDHGYAYRNETFVAEATDIELTGAGVGLRAQHQYMGATGALRLDVGWPVGSIDNTTDNDPIYYLSIEARF